jgi:hypothetical protein
MKGISPNAIPKCGLFLLLFFPKLFQNYIVPPPSPHFAWTLHGMRAFMA